MTELTKERIKELEKLSSADYKVSASKLKVLKNLAFKWRNARKKREEYVPDDHEELDYLRMVSDLVFEVDRLSAILDLLEFRMSEADVRGMKRELLKRHERSRGWGLVR